jgi:hypothetical protein
LLVSVDGYGCEGVPLEEYVLTRADDRWQTSAEESQVWARRTVRDQVEDLRRELGPEAFERHEIELAHSVRALLSRKTPDHQLMQWRLRLYCGHIVIGTRHAEMTHPTLHGCASQRCPECGKDPSTIVAYEPIGLIAEPPAGIPPPAPAVRRPTRAQLERRLRELEAENERLRQASRTRSAKRNPARSASE